jgi:predicted RND superfamily exporter protein
MSTEETYEQDSDVSAEGAPPQSEAEVVVEGTDGDVDGIEMAATKPESSAIASKLAVKSSSVGADLADVGDETDETGTMDVVSGEDQDVDSATQLKTAADKKGQASRAEHSSSRMKPEPLKLAHWIVHYPCRIIITALVAFVVVVILDSIKFELTTNSEHGYFVNKTKKTQVMDSMVLAKEYVSDRSVTSAKPKTQNVQEFLIAMMWRKKGSGTILNSEDINYIVDVENQVANRDLVGYEKNCLSDVGVFPACADNAIVSPFRDISNGNDTEISQSAIDDLINTTLSNTAYLSSFVDDFYETRFSTYYRGYFRFGLPYPDINETASSYTDKNDDFDGQSDKYMDWAWDQYEWLQQKVANKAKKRGLELIVLGGALIDRQFDELVGEAMGFAIFSIITVWVMMAVHLESLFLATCGMWQIISGFPFAYFIYRYILWVPYYDTLSSLIIFVILGIGADDIFVFTDAYNQSWVFVENPSDPEERFAFAFRRASKAMLVTQVTTFFAFLATTISPLTPIAAFGIWAALVVMCNYVMVITFYPAVLSFWEQHVKEFEHKYIICGCCRQCCIAMKEGDPDVDPDEKHEELEKHPVSELTSASGSELSGAEEFQEEMKKARAVERFFGTTFADYIFQARYVFLLVYLAWFILAAVFAAQVEGQDEQEKWFSNDHFVSKALNWPSKFYGGSLAAQMDLTFMWGVKTKPDRSDVKRWDTDYYGEVRFDDEFDMSSPGAQQHIKNACDYAQTDWAEDLYDPFNAESFSCFMYPFMSWVNTTYNGSLVFPYVFDSANATAQSVQFTALMKQWLVTDPVGQLYWVSNDVGYVLEDNRIYYVSIHFLLDEVWYTGVTTRKSYWRRFRGRAKDLNAEAKENNEDGVDACFATSRGAFAWADSAEAFVTSATQGIALALPLAFIVLILSTQNIYLAIYAASTIILILASEVALMVWQGWKLGIGESVSVVIMIGFSVDYVVHFANAYIECEFSDKRMDRVRFALFTMGISVVFGGLTTFGSGFFLYLPEMFFFKKFGVLIMSTVAFSLLFALTYFIPLLMIAGPEGKAGHVPVWLYFRLYITNPIKEKLNDLCGKKA